MLKTDSHLLLSEAKYTDLNSNVVSTMCVLAGKRKRDVTPAIYLVFLLLSWLIPVSKKPVFPINGNRNFQSEELL